MADHLRYELESLSTPRLPRQSEPSVQLRVARLCLDCEELHSDRRCPRCASDSYAFLTNWLPCDERRRFRRDRVSVATSGSWFTALRRVVVSWWRGQSSDTPALATRRSDLVIPMVLDKPDMVAVTPRIVETTTKLSSVKDE